MQPPPPFSATTLWQPPPSFLTTLTHCGNLPLCFGRQLHLPPSWFPATVKLHTAHFGNLRRHFRRQLHTLATSTFFSDGYTLRQPPPALSTTITHFGDLHLRFQGHLHTLAPSRRHFRRQLHTSATKYNSHFASPLSARLQPEFAFCLTLERSTHTIFAQNPVFASPVQPGPRPRKNR